MKEKVVLEYILDVSPDVDRYRDMIHVLEVKEVCRDFNNIQEDFIDQRCISLRKLFNNLDGDERAHSDHLHCEIAGSLLTLAAFQHIYCRTDEDELDEEVPFSSLPNMHYTDIETTIDEEFNTVYECGVDNMCSYLFGKKVLTREFQEKEYEAYEEMHILCENILWSMVMTLADEVSEIATIAEICVNDVKVYPVAYWEEDCMIVSFKSGNSQLSSNMRAFIFNRGIINEERYDNSHRSRIRHRAISENSRTRR